MPIILAYIYGFQKNRLSNNNICFSNHNMFWLRNKKIIFQLLTQTKACGRLKKTHRKRMGICPLNWQILIFW